MALQPGDKLSNSHYGIIRQLGPQRLCWSVSQAGKALDGATPAAFRRKFMFWPFLAIWPLVAQKLG
jgi:hypothetical protein